MRIRSPVIGDALMIFGACVAVVIMALSVNGGAPTPWQLQARQAKGRTYVVQLGSDGCYWRTYMGWRYADSHVDILNDADGGHENCPYRPNGNADGKAGPTGHADVLAGSTDATV